MVRRSERGAAVFVVLLVVTLLTAIGIFAARSASLVNQAAGFDRQLVQTQYLTEYAGRAVATEIGDGAGKSYLDQVVRGSDKCETNKLVLPLATDAPIACYKLYISEINDRVSAKTGNAVLSDQSVAAAGSLGPKLAAAGTGSQVEGLFVVEMTEPFESVPNPGSEAGGAQINAFRDVQLTLTAYGQVRPFAAAASNPWCAVAATSTAASIGGLRAHVTLRNVPR